MPPQETLHVPDLAANLLSVSRLERLGLEVSFANGTCTIHDGRRTHATARRADGLYVLNTVSDRQHALAVVLRTWHARLRHAHPRRIQAMERLQLATGPAFGPSEMPSVCEPCTLGKAHRQPFRTRDHSESRKVFLELVYSDLCGPFQTPSIGGSKYVITITDSHTRWTSTFFLKAKSQAFQAFKQFYASMERESGHTLKTPRTDQGGEYTSTDFQEYLREHGIRHETTLAYTPQQNGVTERTNRTLVDAARAMMAQTDAPKELWAEALSTAAYVKNRLPSRALPHDCTPYSLRFGSPPDFGHLRTFGVTCFAAVPQEKRQKLDVKTTKCIFIGYLDGSKGYKLWDATNRNVIYSRDVPFQDDISPRTFSFEDNGIIHAGRASSVGTRANTPDTQSQPATPATSAAPSPLSDSGLMANTCVAEDTPRSFKAALASAPWRASKDRETRSLQDNYTWQFVPRPATHPVLRTLWVYRTKHEVNKFGRLLPGASLDAVLKDQIKSTKSTNTIHTLRWPPSPPSARLRALRPHKT